MSDSSFLVALGMGVTLAWLKGREDAHAPQPLYAAYATCKKAALLACPLIVLLGIIFFSYRDKC